MSATLIVRHPVADYATWRAVYDSEAVKALHSKYGVSSAKVLRSPDDSNDVLVLHDFTEVDQANAFAADPALQEAMSRGGVSAPPRIEVFELA